MRQPDCPDLARVDRRRYVTSVAMVDRHQFQTVSRTEILRSSEVFWIGGILCSCRLSVKGDVHCFCEGKVDRAALLPSLIDLLHIAFVVGRLDPDVEPDVL